MHLLVVGAFWHIKGKVGREIFGLNALSGGGCFLTSAFGSLLVKKDPS